MPRETRSQKADRLLAAGQVDVLTVTSVDQWTAAVEGDTDTYLVELTPDGPFCECIAGTHGRCSHFMAAKRAVEREGANT